MIEEQNWLRTRIRDWRGAIALAAVGLVAPCAFSAPPVATPQLQIPVVVGHTVYGRAFYNPPVQLQKQSLTCLILDPAGNLWEGFDDWGVWRCDAHTGAWTQYIDKRGLDDHNCTCLACDHQGRIWAGRVNHGVSVYNGKVWQTYGLLDGPLGSHVFALAVSPVDGSVWGATEAGLFCYVPKQNVWKTFNRSDGLPSDECTSLAFDRQGNLIVGTQADGIAIRHATEGHTYWTTVKGPDVMPNMAAGSGLPSNLINCLCVTSTGVIYAGTPIGLAKSPDDGKTWTYLRGKDWEIRVKSLYHGPKIDQTNVPDELLREDFVSSLADNGKGVLFIGHWRQGIEAIEEASGKHVTLAFTADMPDPNANLAVKGPIDNIKTIACYPDGSAICGVFGDGLATIPLNNTGDTPAVPNSTAAPAASTAISSELPLPAKPPVLGELNDLLRTVNAVPPDADELRPKVIALGDDWTTEGDWLGRYGRYFACLCACQGPGGNYYWGAGWEDVRINGQIGPRHSMKMKPPSDLKTKLPSEQIEDAMRYWVGKTYTNIPRALELPAPYVDNRVAVKDTTWKANRRISSNDDHGEAYPKTYDGPHMYYNLKVPHGLFYLSFYDYNGDGHLKSNNCRDFPFSIWLQPNKLAFRQMELFPTGPDVAHARILNFWDGVWKRFLVRGPANLTIKISRNGSLDTILNGIMLDQVDEMPPPYFQTPEQWLTQTVEKRHALRQKKGTTGASSFVPARSEDEAANRLFDAMEDLRLINSTWWSINGRRYYTALLRWYKAQAALEKTANARLNDHLATCSYQLNLFPEWEQYQNKAGLISARQIEQVLRWKGENTSTDDLQLVQGYADIRQANVP